MNPWEEILQPLLWQISMKQEEKAYKHSGKNICKGEPTSTTAENKCSSWDFKASRVLRKKAKWQRNSQQKQKVEINDEVQTSL